MGNIRRMLRLLLFSFLGVLTSAQTITFDCTDQTMTESCNALSTANAISCQSDTVCVACLFSCAIIPTQPPAGTVCADSDCIQGLCGGYSLYLNSTNEEYSCTAIYSNEYCEYCGACLGQVDQGSGFGSGEELCSSSYTSLLCRLLPYNFGQCVLTYGYPTCLLCAGTKNEVSVQQVCPALSVNNITSIELDLICAASNICTITEVCDSNEFDCVYCNYIEDNNLCSVPPTLACDVQIALACRFIDSPTCQYHESTCDDCVDYSHCDKLTLDGFTPELIGVLCNNDLAEGCNGLLMDSNCYANNLPEKCDYCSITNPICNYYEEVASCNATMPTLAECNINVYFLPCRLVYDSDYCIECERALENCNTEQINSSFPMELCSDNNFTGTCDLISAISPSICNDTISPFGCMYCQAISGMFCSASTTNLESAVDYICSDTVFDTCSKIVSENGTCYSTASETECYVCHANLYFCLREEGSGQGDGCESANGIYCRLIAANLTECISKYNLPTCTQCRAAVQFCGSLLSSELSDDETDILCQQNEVCQPFTINSNLCDFDLYEASCNFCDDIVQWCPVTNSTDALCSSNTAAECLISYSYQPCYTMAHPASCQYCETVVQVCPQIGFNSSFVPDAVCNVSVHVAVCNVIGNESLCSSIFGQGACEYCNNVISKCGSLPQSESLILEQACTDLPQCQDIIASTNDTTCEETYTIIDCTYCKFLNYTDCNGSSGDSGGSGGGASGDGGGSGGSGSGVFSNCTIEFTFYCNAILEDPQCNETYGIDCEICQGTAIQCPDYNESGNFSYCSSVLNALLCSQVPAGPACDSIDEFSGLCAYCNFYIGNCTSEICSYENVQACREILIQGSTPNFDPVSSALQQCLLCSLVFQLCPVFQSATTSASFSESLTPSMSSVPPNNISTTLLTSTTILTSSSVSLSISASESIASSMTTFNLPISSMYSSLTSSLSSIFDSSLTSTSLESSIVTSSAFTLSSIVQSSVITTIEEPSVEFSSFISSVMTSSMVDPPQTESSTTTTKTQTTTSTRATTTSTTTTSTTQTTTTTMRPTSTVTPTLPPNSTTNVGVLTQEEIDNSVTLIFNGLTRSKLLQRHTQFTETIAIAINNVIRKKRQAHSVTKEDIIIVEESINEVASGELELSFYVNGAASAPIPQDTIIRAIENNQEEIATAAGADSLASINRGLSEQLTGGGTTESSGLSGGAIAAIVIILVFVLIFAIVGGILGSFIYYSKSHKGKYYITETAGGPEPKFISSNANLEESANIGITNMVMVTKESTQATSVEDISAAEETAVSVEDTTKNDEAAADETKNNEAAADETKNNEAAADDKEDTTKNIEEGNNEAADDEGTDDSASNDDKESDTSSSSGSSSGSSSSDSSSGGDSSSENSPNERDTSF